MAAIQQDKVLTWITRRLSTLDDADRWDAEDFPAGQMAMLREIEDLIENNYFATIGEIND